MASAAQASLLRQQEELDRKAAELERKERELQNTVANLHGEGQIWGSAELGICPEGEQEGGARDWQHTSYGFFWGKVPKVPDRVGFPDP